MPFTLDIAEDVMLRERSRKCVKVEAFICFTAGVMCSAVTVSLYAVGNEACVLPVFAEMSFTFTSDINMN